MSEGWTCHTCGPTLLQLRNDPESCAEILWLLSIKSLSRLIISIYLLFAFKSKAETYILTGATCVMCSISDSNI